MLFSLSIEYKSIYLFIYYKFQLVSFLSCQIFHYDHPTADILHEDFSDRLEWHGTQNDDIQTGAIYIHNVTFNDTGTYRCTIHRTLFLAQYDEHVTVEKEVELSVVAVGKAGSTCEKAGSQ